MYVKRPSTPIAVRLPNGELLSLSDLPPTNTVRWVPQRKMTILRALHAGLITREEVCGRYALSEDELCEWERDSAKSGLDGLKVSVRNT
ncbi:MAG: DUF1153 domain-containing protein [Pseudomonadota bacterium]